MGIRSRVAKWLLSSLFSSKAVANERLPLIAASLSGRALWTDWSTDAAISDGLKASVWVYACVRRLASAVSSVPWIVEETKGDSWQRAQGHPLEILLKEANPYMTGQDLMERLTYHLHLGGNGLWHMVTVRKVPVELWPLMPDKVKPIPDRTKWISHYEYQVSTSESPIKIDAQEILHFQFVDPSNPHWGLAPLQAAAKVVDTDVEAVNWNKVALQNRAITDGVFTFDGVMTKDQWEEAREMVREQHQGSDNARTPWVLGGDAKWQQMSLSPAEMDFLNSRKWSMQEICAVFGVDPLLIAAGERATFNNKVQARRMFWEDTVIPILDDIKEALNLSLIPFWDPAAAQVGVEPKLRLRYDLSNVTALQENFDKKVDSAHKLWQMGVPFNDINQRLELGFEEIPGGDKPRPQYGGADIESAGARGPEARKVGQLSTKAWAEEDKASFWKAMDSDRQRWEDKAVEQINKRFSAELKAVLKGYEQADLDGALAAVDAQTSEWKALLSAIYTAVIEHFGQMEGARLEAGKSAYGPVESKFRFDPFAANVVSWVARFAAEKIQRIAKTTKQRLREAIGEGLAENESSYQISRRIRDTYEKWSSPGDSDIDFSRAMLIARTEVGGAANYGHYEGAVQTGLDIEKEWISSRDDRVRDSHQPTSGVDGERKPLKERYSNGLMYPNDPDGPAEEVIGCRCVEAHHVV